MGSTPIDFETTCVLACVHAFLGRIRPEIRAIAVGADTSARRATVFLAADVLVDDPDLVRDVEEAFQALTSGEIDLRLDWWVGDPLQGAWPGDEAHLIFAAWRDLSPYRRPIPQGTARDLPSAADVRHPAYVALRTLMEGLVTGRIDPRQFERAYLDRFSKLPDSVPRGPYEIFDEVFWLIEDFVDEPEIREQGDLDEKELLRGVAAQLERLHEIGAKDVHRFMCPVCGYPDLTERPRTPGSGGSYEICPSCGFEFGYTDDDQGYTYESWREAWIAAGMPWRNDRVEAPPAGWDPAQQLRKLE